MFNLESYFFRVLAIPTAVFISILFGASYGSGREVVEFVSSNGPTGGLLALLMVAATHSVLLLLSFEIARLYKAFDYNRFTKVLLGPGWVLYEVVILIGMLIALSITTTVGGTVLEDHFGIPAVIGSLLIFAFVIVLTYYGREIVEKSMIVSIVALFGVLLVLAIQLFSGYSNVIKQTFANEAFMDSGIMTGLKYAIGGGGYIPLMLFCAVGLRSRSEACTAAIVAAVLGVVPATIFHFAFMAGYPEVISERIPAYWMFNQVSTPLLLNVYVLVMFVLVAQTGVGILQGLIERIDSWKASRNAAKLSPIGHASVAGGAILVSLSLGSMGVVALVLRGYTIMFMSFIVVFVIPLLSYGAYLVIRGKE